MSCPKLPKKRDSILWFAVTITGLCVFVGCNTPKKHHSSVEPLSVTERDLELGMLVEHQTHHHSLTLINTTDQIIRITGNRNSCNCTSVTPKPEYEIPPGGQKVINIDISAQQPETGSTRFSTDFSLEYSHDGKRSVGRWILTGEFQRRLLKTPNQLKFPTVSELADDLTRTFKAVPAMGVTDVQIIAVDSWITEAVEIRNPSDGTGMERYWEVRLRQARRLPLGAYRAAIHLQPFTTAGAQSIVTIPIRASVVRDVTVHPTLVHFGRLPIGATGESEIRLYSLTEKPFQIISWTAGTSTKIENNKAGDGRFVINHRAEQQGEHRDYVSFTITDAGGVQYVMRVPYAYYGI